MALTRGKRIYRKTDIDELFKCGKVVRGDFLFIKFRGNNLSFSRFGVIVPAKIHTKAATRNKIKRILLETIRLNLNKIKGGLDVLVVANRKTQESLSHLKEDLLKTINKVTY